MSNAFKPEWQGERVGNRVARLAAATGTTLAVTAPTARLASPSGSDEPLTDLIAAAFDADPGSVS
jgi:hypothetical protein